RRAPGIVYCLARLRRLPDGGRSRRGIGLFGGRLKECPFLVLTFLELGPKLRILLESSRPSLLVLERSLECLKAFQLQLRPEPGDQCSGLDSRCTIDVEAWNLAGLDQLSNRGFVG